MKKNIDPVKDWLDAKAEEDQRIAAAGQYVRALPEIARCGHQLTEEEEGYYERHPELDKLCRNCVMNERAR